MTVEIKPKQLAIIEQQLATGLYQSADEVVATAIDSLPSMHRASQGAVARMLDFSRRRSVKLAAGETVKKLIEEGHRY